MKKFSKYYDESSLVRDEGQLADSHRNPTQPVSTGDDKLVRAHNLCQIAGDGSKCAVPDCKSPVTNVGSLCDVHLLQLSNAKRFPPAANEAAQRTAMEFDGCDLWIPKAVPPAVSEAAQRITMELKPSDIERSAMEISVVKMELLDLLTAIKKTMAILSNFLFNGR